MSLLSDTQGDSVLNHPARQTRATNFFQRILPLLPGALEVANLIPCSWKDGIADPLDEL